RQRRSDQKFSQDKIHKIRLLFCDVAQDGVLRAVSGETGAGDSAPDLADEGLARGTDHRREVARAARTRVVAEARLAVGLGHATDPRARVPGHVAPRSFATLVGARLAGRGQRGALHRRRVAGELVVARHGVARIAEPARMLTGRSDLSGLWIVARRADQS